MPRKPGMKRGTPSLRTQLLGARRRPSPGRRLGRDEAIASDVAEGLANPDEPMTLARAAAGLHLARGNGERQRRLARLRGGAREAAKAAEATAIEEAARAAFLAAAEADKSTQAGEPAA